MAAPTKNVQFECSDEAVQPMVLEPLTFDIRCEPHVVDTYKTNNKLICLFCEDTFDVATERELYVGHMVQQHKMLIADFKQIHDFKRYIEYWRERMKGRPLEEFCTVIKTNSKLTDIDPSETYYMLCDVLPEDKVLRKDLQQQKLLEVLELQQFEREVDPNFCKMCLFCREQFKGVRLNCLYCEKTFKDRHVLKEHMRKKQHKKIDPKNKTYDKFYIINYLELGKNWEDIQSEDDRETENESENPSEEWSGWVEEDGVQASSMAVCLFCSHSAQVELLMEHMKREHQFDLVEMKHWHKLTFYQQVKIVNYIRRQVHLHTCFVCEKKCDDSDTLNYHLHQSGHTSQLPSAATWDQSLYLFPTFENDNLLCWLEGEDEGAETEGAVAAATGDENVVIAEDLNLENVQARKAEIIHLLT